MHQPFFAVALMAFGGSALGHVVVKEATEFYDVRHSAGITLLDAINSVTPVRKNGQLFHGYTAWDINWAFRWQKSSAGLCEITSVTTSLLVTTTLPRLLVSTQGAATQFNQFFPALVAHEQGHRRIVLDAANQADRAIAGLQPMSDCHVLEREANRVGLDILESSRRRHAEYDSTTQHGCKQGACLTRSR